MNSKFINVLMFAAGAAIGSAVTYKLVKTRYEEIVQEEIVSIKEAFSGNESDATQEYTEDSDDEDRRGLPGQINWEDLEDLDEDDEEDLVEYTRLTDMYRNDEEGGAKSMPKRPYVISPYDFGEIDEYKQFELTYYADGVLEDDDYAIVTDVDELIGTDSLNTFGEYEDDAVFVRNESLGADFQILKDYRTYEEARGVSPDQVGNE